MKTTLIFFFFSYLPLICCVGDPDTVAAEGNLAVMKVFVLFQWFSVDEKDAEDSHCRPSLNDQVPCQGPQHTSAHLFYIHLVQRFQKFCFVTFLLFFHSLLPLSLCAARASVHMLIKFSYLLSPGAIREVWGSSYSST